jgi:hypothetical protein
MICSDRSRIMHPFLFLVFLLLTYPLGNVDFDMLAQIRGNEVNHLNLDVTGQTHLVDTFTRDTKTIVDTGSQVNPIAPAHSVVALMHCSAALT